MRIYRITISVVLPKIHEKSLIYCITGKVDGKKIWQIILELNIGAGFLPWCLSPGTL